MKVVAQIKQPIEKEMELFEKKFSSSMTSKVALLNRITHYIVNRKGKQMRPMFIFLVSKMSSNGTVNERTYRGASVIELIHTATLVHDDVVDDSNRRRGFFSINALWKNKIAVLVGDYLLSKGLLLSIDNGDFDLLKIISVAVREMSEGELLQIEKARRLDITEDIYYEIIRQKTATLIAACCAMGAKSVNASDEEVERLIYALNHCTKEEKKWAINSIKNHNKDKKRVKEVIAFVKKTGGLEYAVTQMKTYQEKALKLLETYPQSTYKDSLVLMVNYVIDRKK